MTWIQRTRARLKCRSAAQCDALLCVDHGDSPTGLGIDIEIVGQPVRARSTTVACGVECPGPRTNGDVVATGLGSARDLNHACSHPPVSPSPFMPIVVRVT